MSFLYEKQARRFYVFIAAVCIIQICFMGFSGLLQARGIRRVLVKRELGAASYLLEQDISPAVIASAWNHTEATAEGRRLLEKIGHTERTQGYLLLLTEETSVPTILLLTGEGVLLSVILLAGVGIFLQGRERIYEKAERVVAQYAEGRFDDRMPEGRGGSLSSMPGGANGSLSSMPGGANGSLSSMPGGANGSLSPMPGGANGSLSSMPGEANGAFRSMPGRRVRALSPMPGRRVRALSPMPEGRGGSLSSMPGGANGSLSSMPQGETGALYHLLGQVDQLALSLQAKSEAECKAKEFLRDMISNISHQLKTPLAAMGMYMEILAGEAGNPETVRTFSRKSMCSLERMEQLIQALLKMARLDTGNILFERRQCPVTEIVEQAAGELRERAAQEKKLILTEGIPEETVCCDMEWTTEAVGNLIKNALDHMEEGGTVRIAWKRSPAILRLTVADDGCGIAPEDIYHIFKRFYRSGSSGHRQGAGLGLSLAKSIVEGQGGALSVESSPGKGSTFSISFPAS